MKRWISWMAAALVLVMASSAVAADWSVLGGRTLDARRSAFRAQVGWPDINFAYHYPITSHFEIAPKLGVVYGLNAFGVGFETTTIGNSFGSEFRWNVFNAGKFHLAAKGELDLLVYYDIADQVEAGMRILPGVVMDFDVLSKLNVVLSFEMPFEFLFTDPVSALIPILFGFGVEYEVIDNLLLTFDLNMGPSVFVIDEFSDTGFGFQGHMGVAYQF